MNAHESQYLMQIAENSHPSQKILQGRDPVGPVPNMDLETGSKHSGRSRRSNMSQTVDDLKNFNESLRTDLNDLKSYLHETNKRLEDVAQRSHRSGRSSARSRSSLGHSEVGKAAQLSARHSARSRSSRGYTMRSRSSASKSSARGSPFGNGMVPPIPEEMDGDPETDPTRRKSARIKGYRIGHEVEMMQHSNGNRFPVIGPGRVTESHTQRHRNMVQQVEINPVVPDDDGHKRMFLNNLFMEDPSNNSDNWQAMFRHGLKTFQNKHDCNIPYHTATFCQV